MSEICNIMELSGKSKKRYNGRLWEINWWYLPICELTITLMFQVCGLPANKPSTQSRVGATPSHDAAAVGNTDTLRWLLEHTDSHISDVDDTGATVVHLAARYGHLRMLKWLVTEVDGGREATHAQTLSRALPLHLAAMNGHLDVVKFLVEHGVM